MQTVHSKSGSLIFFIAFYFFCAILNSIKGFYIFKEDTPMAKQELYERSPIRAFDAAANGGLKAGEI